MKTSYIIAAAALVGFGMAGALKPLTALAEDTMAGHDMAAMSPWAQAYDAANMVMHDRMMITYSDNPDLDFARAMIEHHEGAIAMARIELEHGNDPEIRKLAEGMIAAQTAEIVQMHGWIATQ